MDFWNLEKIKEAAGELNTYNFPENWTATGLRIWHEAFRDRNMLVMREEGEERGAFKKNIDAILPQISAFVTSNAANYQSYGLPIIEVKDTNKFIVDAGKYIRNHFNGKIIAITGSSGKSTTTRMLYDALYEYGVCANLTQENTVHGICWHMTNFSTDAKYWVIESSIGRGAMTIPDIAIVTNVAPVHLAKNQTIEDIARAKAKTFDTMAEGKTAILCRETECFDIFLNAAKAKNLKIITVGLSDDCDVKIFGNTIKIYDKEYSLGDDFIPNHLKIDMALALAAVNDLGENVQNAVDILTKFQSLAGRGETFTGKIQPNRTITLVDESYNANPLSMKATLEAFGEKYRDKNKVLILGDMAEGGQNTLKQHLDLIPVIRQVKPEKILLTGETMKEVWDMIKPEFKGEYFTNVADLNKSLLQWIADGDCVFVKSSHSGGLYKTVNVIKNFMKNFT